MNKISMCTICVVVLLLGCSSQEEKFVANIKEQEATLVKVREIVRVNPKDKRVDKMLEDVSDLETQLLNLKIKYNNCSQRGFDDIYRNFLSDNVKYLIKLYDADSPENLLELYKKYGEDSRKMTDVEKMVPICLKHYGEVVVVRSEYVIENKNLDELNAKLKIKFKEKSGQDFNSQWVKKVSQEYVSNHVKAWDEMNEREKAMWAKDDKEVVRCIDATLSDNQQSENIPNIISDTASLCRKGLAR